MARKRGLIIGLMLCVVLVAAAAYFISAGGPSGLKKIFDGSRISFPEKVLMEDFQRPLDRDVTEQLVLFERTGVSNFIDAEILKPFFDDVQTLQLAVTGVELTPEQFPERQDLIRIVEDCARVLEIPRPRVFIANVPGTNAYTTNFADPVIVITSTLIRRFRDPDELRFIIGHEMSHIRAGHVKWKTVLHGMVESARKMKILPAGAASLPLLPFLKWAREAEMTADNGGLLCCQSLDAAENALVRLALNIGKEEIGRINVDAFLKQREAEDLSQFSEIMLFWRQLLLEHPFIPDRIVQLREYEKGRAYRHLWE